jgi:hypothetical protein
MGLPAYRTWPGDRRWDGETGSGEGGQRRRASKDKGEGEGPYREDLEVVGAASCMNAQKLGVQSVRRMSFAGDESCVLCPKKLVHTARLLTSFTETT